MIQTACLKIDDDLRWLVALISDTGMKLSEAAGLKIDDLVLDDEIPHVVIQPHNHRPLPTYQVFIQYSMEHTQVFSLSGFSSIVTK